MLVKRIAACTHLSSTVYDIGRKLQPFPTPLHLTPLLGVFPLEFREKFGLQKTRIMGLPSSEDSLTIVRFDTIPACDGQTDRRTDGRTDGQTDVQPISITCAV